MTAGASACCCLLAWRSTMGSATLMPITEDQQLLVSSGGMENASLTLPVGAADVAEDSGLYLSMRNRVK